MYRCPYCQTDSVSSPPVGEYYQTCTNCGLRPRAKIWVSNNTRHISYVATGKKRVGDDDKTEVYAVRLSRRDGRKLKDGSLRLELDGKSLRKRYNI